MSAFAKVLILLQFIILFVPSIASSSVSKVDAANSSNMTQGCLPTISQSAMKFILELMSDKITHVIDLKIWIESANNSMNKAQVLTGIKWANEIGRTLITLVVEAKTTDRLMLLSYTSTMKAGHHDVNIVITEETMRCLFRRHNTSDDGIFDLLVHELHQISGSKNDYKLCLPFKEQDQVTSYNCCTVVGPNDTLICSDYSSLVTEMVPILVLTTLAFFAYIAFPLTWEYLNKFKKSDTHYRISNSPMSISSIIHSVFVSGCELEKSTRRRLMFGIFVLVTTLPEQGVFLWIYLGIMSPWYFFLLTDVIHYDESRLLKLTEVTYLYTGGGIMSGHEILKRVFNVHNYRKLQQKTLLHPSSSEDSMFESDKDGKLEEETLLLSSLSEDNMLESDKDGKLEEETLLLSSSSEDNMLESDKDDKLEEETLLLSSSSDDNMFESDKDDKLEEETLLLSSSSEDNEPSFIRKCCTSFSFSLLYLIALPVALAYNLLFSAYLLLCTFLLLAKNIVSFPKTANVMKGNRLKQLCLIIPVNLINIVIIVYSTYNMLSLAFFLIIGLFLNVEIYSPYILPLCTIVFYSWAKWRSAVETKYLVLTTNIYKVCNESRVESNQRSNNVTDNSCRLGDTNQRTDLYRIELDDGEPIISKELYDQVRKHILPYHQTLFHYFKGVFFIAVFGYLLYILMSMAQKSGISGSLQIISTISVSSIPFIFDFVWKKKSDEQKEADSIALQSKLKGILKVSTSNATTGIIEVEFTAKAKTPEIVKVLRKYLHLEDVV